MKLASRDDNTLDGQLMVVSRDLARCVVVADIAPTLQSALDRWDEVSGALVEAFENLNTSSDGDPFLVDEVLSPLPRAYQWADGSSYVNHVELVRKARGAEMPASFWTDPLMYQGGSDCFLTPTGNIEMASEEWGIDFEGELAVITDQIPAGTTAEGTGNHIKLFMLVNDVSLRNLIPAELGKGFGFFQSKPSSAFGPVAITPDELGEHWDGHRVFLPLVARLNGKQVGAPEAGDDMVFDFPTLVAHVAKTRALGPGSIVGSGTVSNVDRSKGITCIAEARMLETIETGEPTTPFMQFGDRIELEMCLPNGDNLFGTINQVVTQRETV